MKSTRPIDSFSESWRLWPLPAVFLILLSPVRAEGDRISREDAFRTMEVLHKLDPNKGDMKERLILMCGDNDSYSPADLKSVIGPEDKVPGNPDFIHRPGGDKLQRGELPAADVEATLGVIGAASMKKTREENLQAVREKYQGESRDELLRVIADGMPASENLMEALRLKAGVRQGYTASEFRDVRDNGSKPAPFKLGLDDPPYPKGWAVISYGLSHPRIRQSWSDVLLTEDPSAPISKAKLDDLVGATFSYSHDRTTGKDTWNATGALIFPFIWQLPVHFDDFAPEKVALLPSVTVNRVENGNDPAQNVDEILYRLGSSASWEHPAGSLDLRLAAVYATDSHHEASLPGFELDLEPQFDWRSRPAGGDSIFSNYFKLGFKNILLKKEPYLEDQSDNSALDYQLRAFLHVEGGDVQESGGKWSVVTENFLRLGPTAQLRLNMPHLIFDKTFSLTAQYSKMSSVEGPNDHNESLKLDATLTLMEDVATGHKISINANYTNGGTDFIQEDVDLYTVGLSVRF